MKRCFAILLAALMLTGCTPTSDTTEQNPDLPEETRQLIPGEVRHEVNMTNAYSSELLMPDVTSFARDCFNLIGDRIVINAVGNGIAPVLLNPETGEYLRHLTSGYLCMLGAAAQGEDFQILYENKYDYEPDIDITYEFVTYDKDFQEISSEEFIEPGDGQFVYAWTIDHDGYEYITVLDTLYCRPPEGAFAEVETTDMFTGLFTSANGKTYGVSVDGRWMLSIIDPKTLTAERVTVKGMPPECKGFCAGDDVYDFFCFDNIALYGVRDGIAEEVINWDNSDFNGELVEQVTPDGNGNFLMICAEPDWSASYCYKLTKRPQEELDNLQLISLAGCQVSIEIQDMVHRFNRQSKEYRIVIQDYMTLMNTTYDTELARAGFESDLIAGNVPDIVFLPGMGYEILANKGMFEDLRPWIEQETDFRDSYFMNFLDSMEYRGRLERMAFHFNVSAMAAKSKFMPDSLAPEEYSTLTLPEGMTLVGNLSSMDVLNEFVLNSLGRFIDTEQMSCSFDSPEFIKLLALCGSFPAQRGVAETYGVQEERVLLYHSRFGDLMDYHMMKTVMFGGEDMTFSDPCFYPVSPLAMCSQSEYKAQIWEFFMFSLNEENQVRQYIDGDYPVCFPLNIAALETQMESFQDTEQSYRRQFFVRYDDFIIESDAATEQEATELLDFLKSVKICKFSNEKVTNIIEEEAGKYFAGDQTAEIAAGMIQSRVGLYLAEQSG